MKNKLDGPLGTFILFLVIVVVIALTVWFASAAIGCWSGGGTWVPNAFPQKCMK